MKILIWKFIGVFIRVIKSALLKSSTVKIFLIQQIIDIET